MPGEYKDSDVKVESAGVSEKGGEGVRSVPEANWLRKKYVRFKGYIKGGLLAPYYRFRWYVGELSWYRSELRVTRDAEANLSGKLNEDDGLHVAAVWVGELYTPSTMDGLLGGIKSLGWEYSARRNDSVMEWLGEFRAGRSSGWVSLGLTVPKGARDFVLPDREAILPKGVKGALANLTSITPSLTSMTIAFILDESTASAVEAPMKADFSSVIERNKNQRFLDVLKFIFRGSQSGRVSRYHFSPDTVRSLEAGRILDDIEHRCVKWMRSNFPGVFSEIPEKEVPTAFLMVSEKTKPLEDGVRLRAWDGIGLNNSSLVWKSKEWPAVRVVIPGNLGRDGRRLIFAGRRDDIFDDDLGYLDPKSDWSIASRADGYVRGLLNRWSVTALLDVYYEDLSLLRDDSAYDRGYSPIRDLKRLRSLARTHLFDIGICTQELLSFTESRFVYCFDLIEMKRLSRAGGKEINLSEEMREAQRTRAIQVQRVGVLLQESLSFSSNLSQIISNIRIQRFVVFLTVISIAVAVWAAVKAT